MLVCVHCFFILVSPLSLRLFKFMEVFIFSCCSVFLFFVFFSPFWRRRRRLSYWFSWCWFSWCCYCCFFVVVAGFVITSVVGVSAAFVVGGGVAPVVCSIFFPFPVTWIHPSSGFGWFPDSMAGLVVGLMVFSWLLLLFLLMLLLVWLLFNDFCEQVPARWPSCLLDQLCGLLLSTTTIIC